METLNNNYDEMEGLYNMMKEKGFTKEETEAIKSKIQDRFTIDRQEEISNILQKLLIIFPLFCKIFESNSWKNAFNSKELKENVTEFKNFSDVSDEERKMLESKLEVYDSIINMESGFTFFECIKNNVLVFANDSYCELKYSENPQAIDVIPNLYGILVELHKLDNLVLLSRTPFINENEGNEWVYSLTALEIIVKKFDKFYHNLFSNSYEVGGVENGRNKEND